MHTSYFLQKKLKVHTVFGVVFLLCSILLPVSFVGAQSLSDVGIAKKASLDMDPAFPEPESEVTVLLDAYTVDTSGATILWHVNGKEVVTSRNERSTKIKLGELGEVTKVSATVTLVSGNSFVLRKDITATAVDLVLEAETYVPPFYRGRALPSAETKIRIVAIPHLGSQVNPKNLSYRWEYTGGLLFGGPIRGKQAIDLTVSPYSGGYVVVSVMNEAGAVVAGKVMSIETGFSPEFYFYEENPLRGLNEIAIKDTFTLIGDETTIHGEPYFLASDVSPDTLDFLWRINNEKVTNVNNDPHTITLRKEGGSGTARVNVEAITTTPLPRYTGGAFTVTF